jgi:predicted SnoaL-like aldol condensation-catalyzing enzyme
MSQENVEIVEEAINAVNERDLEIGGVYDGPDGIRRFFADVRDTSPDFQITIERAEAIGADRVLAFLRVSASGRASGIPAARDTPTTNIYDFANGKIKRIRIFLDREQALEAAGLRR